MGLPTFGTPCDPIIACQIAFCFGDCSTGLYVRAIISACRRQEALRGCAQISGLEEALGAELPGDLETEDARASLDRLVRPAPPFVRHKRGLHAAALMR